MTTPKCKTCNWKIKSGKKSYCNHPKAPKADKGRATYLSSKDTKSSSPNWCPLRIV